MTRTDFIKSNKEDTITKKISYHKVKSGENLSLIAKKYKMRVSDLKKLNRLKSNRLKINQKLKIRSTKTYAAKTITKPKSKKNIPSYHVVKPGETLSTIAAKYQIRTSHLKTVNGLKSNFIKANQKLKLSKTHTSKQKSVSVAKTASKTKTGYHVIKSGETLSHVASKYRVYVSQIKKWNHLKSNRVKVGQKLKIYATNAKNTKSAINKSKVIFHKVKPGETLWSLSKKYQVKINDIMKWNKLKNDTVKPNQKIKIIAAKLSHKSRA